MKRYTMTDYEDDLSVAMREIEETKEAMIKTEITPEFLLELERVRLDLGVSPYVNLTEEMMKWVIIALDRANKANTNKELNINQVEKRLMDEFACAAMKATPEDMEIYRDIAKQVAVPMPMTDDEKTAAWFTATLDLPSGENCYMRGIADAEAHHGIGAKP